MTDRELLWPAQCAGTGYTVPAVYAERVGESRLIGRCTKAGCKHRNVVDAVVFLPDAVQPREVEVIPTGDPTRPWAPLSFRFNTLNPSAYERNLRTVFERLGLFCPEHGRTVKLRGIKGCIAQNVKCTSRCHNATSDTCDCECGGQAHGSAWQRH